MSSAGRESCWVFCFNHGTNDQKSANLMVTQLLDIISNSSNTVRSATADTGNTANRNRTEDIVAGITNTSKFIEISPNADPKSYFPPALESTLNVGTSAESLARWAEEESLDRHENEASSVPRKIRENYTKYPDRFEHYNKPHTRKAFVNLMKLSREETARLVSQCRSKGVTVTSLLSAAVLLTTSLFLQSSGDDVSQRHCGEKKEKKKEEEGHEEGKKVKGEEKEEEKVSVVCGEVGSSDSYLKENKNTQKGDGGDAVGNEIMDGKQDWCGKEDIIVSQTLRFYLAVDSRPYGTLGTHVFFLCLYVQHCIISHYIA